MSFVDKEGPGLLESPHHDFSFVTVESDLVKYPERKDARDGHFKAFGFLYVVKLELA